MTVLVLRALGLGDLLTAVPALRGLRAAYPGRRVVLAAPPGLREIAALTGAVDDLVPAARLGPVPWHGPPPAVAVNLHGSGPQSIQALRGLRPGALITHAHPRCPGVPGPAWDPDAHEVHRWCRLLYHHGIAADADDLALARPAATNPAPGAVVVHPGAAFPTRRWPSHRFGAVAASLAARGVPVVVTGSRAERGTALEVAAHAGLPRSAVLAGRTSLPQLAALVAAASLVISGDTGVGHLATAYATPSVVLFGPVSPNQWGPPPHRHQHIALWSGITSDPFAPASAPGLLRISVAEVTEAAIRLLGSVAHRRGRPDGAPLPPPPPR